MRRQKRQVTLEKNAEKVRIWRQKEEGYRKPKNGLTGEREEKRWMIGTKKRSKGKERREKGSKTQRMKKSVNKKCKKAKKEDLNGVKEGKDKEKKERMAVYINMIR